MIACKDGLKVVHYGRLQRYLFVPVQKVDKATNDLVEKFAGEAVAVLVREMEDQNKATWKYLSINKQPYSWEHMSAKRRAALVGVTSTNDEAESVLGGTTSNIQKFGRINLTGAAAISDTKRNAIFYRPIASSKNSKPRGLFHELDDQLQQAIFETSIADVPA